MLLRVDYWPVTTPLSKLFTQQPLVPLAPGFFLVGLEALHLIEVRVIPHLTDCRFAWREYASSSCRLSDGFCRRGVAV